jgi:LemA protein
MVAVIVIVVLVVVVVGFTMLAFNGLVRRRNQVDDAWSQIDVQLKRRYDLIPNLVETVKGYASHERGTFEEVVSARANAISAQQSGRQCRDGCAQEFVRGRGGVPGSEGEPEFPPAPRRTELDGGSDRVVA